MDVIALLIIIGFVIIVLYKAVKWLYKQLEWRKRLKTSMLIEKHCRDCKHAFMGNDYLTHCPLMTGIKVCHPKTMECYRRKEG